MNERDAPDNTGYTPADWAGDSARRWASQADRLEAQLQPIADLLAEAAALRIGDDVLDIGCGRAVTSRQAARAVGPSGAVTGIDISDELIGEARSAAAEFANVEFVVADAQTHPLAANRYDVAISRFGTMFFDDPVAAFTNIRHAMRDGGRLVMVVWQHRDRSEMMEAPLQVGVAALQALGHDVELPPANGGPFSLGDPEDVERVLTEAGWQSVNCVRRDIDLYNGGPGSVDDAIDVSLTIGPLRLMLADHGPAEEAAVRSALRDDYARRHDGIGVRFSGGVLVVTAEV